MDLRPARSLAHHARCRRPLAVYCVTVRANSSKATNPGASPSTSAGTVQKELSWPEYLAIRRSKRKWETALTIPASLLGLAGGGMYFGSIETDATKPIMGIDPIFFYGGCTVACAGLGYLIGPTLGEACWRLTHRSTLPLIEARDREFHRRIVKNRVDPRSQSATNPVPDFYGEKIGSLHGYRQWLRDQARYKRKSLLPEE